jgi:hypothetical protein
MLYSQGFAALFEQKKILLYLRDEKRAIDKTDYSSKLVATLGFKIKVAD